MSDLRILSDAHIPELPNRYNGKVRENYDLPDGSRITASFGVSHLSRGGRFDDAYGLADEALYAAKRSGRNQVVRAADCVLSPMACSH